MIQIKNLSVFYHGKEGKIKVLNNLDFTIKSDEIGEIKMEKKLYRNTENKMIAGVCSGLAEYINIDPTIIRLIWALIALSGAGLIAYLLAAIIIPEKPSNIIDV